MGQIANQMALELYFKLKERFKEYRKKKTDKEVTHVNKKNK